MNFANKTDAYREGYVAYQQWNWHSGSDRTGNPYHTGNIHGESLQYHEWQQGWDDASFDD